MMTALGTPTTIISSIPTDCPLQRVGDTVQCVSSPWNMVVGVATLPATITKKLVGWPGEDMFGLETVAVSLAGWFLVWYVASSHK